MLLPQVADHVRGSFVFLAEIREPAKGIQEFELIGRLEKGVTFALAVDVDQHFANAFECADCDWHFVDERGTAARPRQAAGEDEVVFFDGSLQDFRGDGTLFGPGQFEPAGDAKFIGTGANQVGVAAFAQEQTRDAPSRSDFPAPVSPVQAQKPGCSSTRTSSIRARF